VLYDLYYMDVSMYACIVACILKILRGTDGAKDWRKIIKN
jgi:hypothetical protein